MAGEMRIEEVQGQIELRLFPVASTEGRKHCNVVQEASHSSNNWETTLSDEGDWY
jgi:hypothetical protein